MELRTKIDSALKSAMKNKEATRLSTLRLINAAIKDMAIARRGSDNDNPVSDQDVLDVLTKMVKQRRESARAYEEAARIDLAERERAEIALIEEFLPKQLSEQEVDAAIDKAVQETGASSLRDMGKVMGALKALYAGQMDFGAVGALVKSRLG